MITITIHFPSLLIGMVLGLAVIGVVMIGSLYTDAWDDGFMEGYKVRKDGQTECDNRDHEGNNQDTEKV